MRVSFIITIIAVLLSMQYSLSTIMFFFMTIAVSLVFAIFVVLIALKASFQDWLLIKGLIFPMFQHLKAAKGNFLIDEYWYWRLQQQPQDEPAIIDCERGSKFTWRDIENFSNRVSHWAIKRNFACGSVIGLMLPNMVEYVPLWLGLAKVGVQAALLNCNLKGDGLRQSITAGDCVAIVTDKEFVDEVSQVTNDLENMPIYVFGDERDSFVQELDMMPVFPVAPQERATARGVSINDPVLLIFTSGTTGLPKAAKISHFRYRLAGSSFAGVFGLNRKDRLYCPLPLYHSAAGMVGVGILLQVGCTMILRRKFSATKFVSDCFSFKVTCIQYVGEVARYLVAAPKDPLESALSIRLAIGNGLRSDVWHRFKSRFGIQKICEFYASTEGAAPLFNVSDVDFSVGYMSPIASLFSPSALIRFDHLKDDILRGKNGLCIPCTVGEVGEYVVKVKNTFGASNFSGYTDSRASENKLLRDVFEKGDVWFRSGDLLKMDSKRNVYFADRIGDNFRWKGENCSATQIEGVIGLFEGSPESIVYGVEVPNYEGRAAMAAILQTEQSFSLDKFYHHLKLHLPRFAFPVFLKFVHGIKLTSTYKHVKIELKKEGISVCNANGSLYFLQKDSYVPLTDCLYKDITLGKIKI